MAYDLSSVKKEKVLRAPRILVIGTEKIGKSSFACGCSFEPGNSVPVAVGLNNPIVIPVKGEEGVDDLEVACFPTVNTYDDLMGALQSLCGEHEYQTAVLDSASTIGPMIDATVCEEFSVNNIRKVPGFKTGEAACENKWRNILNALDYLRSEKNMASIIISHVRIKKHKNPEGDDYDKYDCDVDTTAGEMLKRWADVILFCNTKVVVKVQGEDTKFSQAKKTGKDISGGQRFLYTQQRPAHPGGGRGVYGRLPYELPLDWKAFSDAVALAAQL